MKILLTNDDGIDAPGINILAAELEKNGHDLVLIAPDKEQSASSHSITLHEPLRIHQRSRNRFAVTGSPADCIILASRVIIKDDIELVISGINGGQNMGEDILYSGTVAAALEAMFVGYRAMAVSLASYSEKKFETASYFVSWLLKKKIHELISDREIFNINVPNVEVPEIKGIKITKTGHRLYKDFVSEQKDPRGRIIYWIGGKKALWVDEEGTDFKAVSENYISLSPIAPSFNIQGSFEKIEKWVKANLFEHKV